MPAAAAARALALVAAAAAARGVVAAGQLDGTLLAWGSEGALGAPPSDDGTPAEVSELDNAVARLAAGSDHTVVLRSSGAVYTFGSGALGQLGHGDRAARALPTRVASSVLGSDVALVAAGASFSVVVRVAAQADWQLFAWGTNDWGQLGIGSVSATPAETPRAVSTLSSAAVPSGVASLQSGRAHTLVVLDDGAVWGWGSNQRGALAAACPAPAQASTPGCAVSRPAALPLGSLRVSFAAAGVQVSGLDLHQHFNHNDLYHVIQLVGLYAFYRGGLMLTDR